MHDAGVAGGDDGMYFFRKRIAVCVHLAVYVVEVVVKFVVDLSQLQFLMSVEAKKVFNFPCAIGHRSLTSHVLGVPAPAPLAAKAKNGEEK